MVRQVAGGRMHTVLFCDTYFVLHSKIIHSNVSFHSLFSRLLNTIEIVNEIKIGTDYQCHLLS